MRVDINALINLAGILLAFFIGLKATKNSTKEITENEQDRIKAESYEKGQRDLQLKNISDNVQKTLKKVESLDEKLNKIEDKADTANRRIDAVEKEIEEIKSNYEGT